MNKKTLKSIAKKIVYISFLEVKLKHANERAEEYKDWIFKEKPE